MKGPPFFICRADGVLQEELNRTASDKMKDIVATIQRNQNAASYRNTSTGTCTVRIIVVVALPMMNCRIREWP